MFYAIVFHSLRIQMSSSNIFDEIDSAFSVSALTHKKTHFIHKHKSHLNKQAFTYLVATICSQKPLKNAIFLLCVLDPIFGRIVSEKGGDGLYRQKWAYVSGMALNLLGVTWIKDGYSVKGYLPRGARSLSKRNRCKLILRQGKIYLNHGNKGYTLSKMDYFRCDDDDGLIFISKDAKDIFHSRNEKEGDTKKIYMYITGNKCLDPKSELYEEIVTYLEQRERHMKVCGIDNISDYFDIEYIYPIDEKGGRKRKKN